MSLLVFASMAALAIGWSPRTSDELGCRQHDCDASGLRWHTDLDQARAEARASGKPILSLRLLGRLDEELSCANSRFFRTVLYPDPRVNQMLREGFVLHWESLRPAPRITVEFGDGRKLVRTITGNSVHYVLDSEGRVVDALPGLYSPPAFLRELEPARRQALAVSGLDEAHWRSGMAEWHGRGSVQRRPIDPVEPAAGTARAAAAEGTPAILAQGLFVSKTGVERPLPAVLAGADLLRLEARPDGEREREITRERRMAERIAEASLEEARLSEASLELMRRTLGGAVSQTMRENFELSIAGDSAFNERFQHRRIRARLALEPYGADLHSLDRWLYAEVFLSPLDDPWYGLVDLEVYAGLDGNGLVTAAP